MVGEKERSDKPQQGNHAKTKQTRGLSQRLRKPLSIERNLPPDLPAAELVPETAMAASSPTRDEAKDSELGTRKVSRLEARQSVPADASQPASTEGLLSEGAQLQSRYRILGRIGVGGMGAVYKAQDLRFANVQRLCAIKEMINTAPDPQVRQMIIRNFEREASILATLSHPAIPQVYDYFTEGSRSYLVQEFIHGKDLEDLLAETDGFFSESRVLDWATQLCDVLTYLHNHEPRPIIFRDLKPSNVMLDDHDRIRLVDFGIAKLFQSGEKGTMIGTEGYSPPEQYRGVAEPRGDIYALGATMHHLLSKQDPRLEPPFSFHERPIYKTNPTVSRELVDILDKALEYDINKRWGSSEELKREFMGLLGVQGKPRGETGSLIGGSVKPLWRFACEDEIRTSVAVDDDLVYVPSYDNNVYALEMETGKFVWKYPTEGGVGTSPWVSDGLVIFGSSDKVVYAVESRSGRLVWTVPTKAKIFSSPYGEFGHIFIGSDDSELYAIHLLSGRLAWTYKTDGAVRSTPIIRENTIFFACEMGMVYALTLNRDIKWRFRARRGFLSSPYVMEGLLFIGSLDWNFYALDIRSGWAAWRYRTGGPIVSTPAGWEGLIFFGSADGYFYALDAAEGRLVWRHQVGEQITSSPTVYGGNVYFGAVDGALYCLDAHSGTLRWRYQTEGPITAAPVIVDDVLYVGSMDHYVYAIPA